MEVPRWWMCLAGEDRGELLECEQLVVIKK